MKRLVINPSGWPCSLEDCPPGFFLYLEQLCFKTEYRVDNEIQVYCGSGETFCVDNATVQPVWAEWETYEE